MGQVLTSRSQRGDHGSPNASRESLVAQGPFDDTASSSSAPLAHVSVAMDNNPTEVAMYSPFGTSTYGLSGGGGHQRILNQGYTYTSGDDMNMIMTTTGHGNNTGGHSLGYLLQELAAVLPHVFTRGGRGRNGGGSVPAAIDFLGRRRWRDYDLEAQWRLHHGLEAGGQAHRVVHLLAAAADGAQRTGGGAAAPVQEPSEVAKMLEGVMVQAFAAFLPACVTAYPLLKDAPDHVKFTIFGGLAFTTLGLFVGILPRSVARRELAIRLVSSSAIAVLAFSVASQLSSRTYVALTALVGVAVNLMIMLLRF